MPEKSSPVSGNHGWVARLNFFNCQARQPWENLVCRVRSELPQWIWRCGLLGFPRLEFGVVLGALPFQHDFLQFRRRRHDPARCQIEPCALNLDCAGESCMWNALRASAPRRAKTSNRPQPCSSGMLRTTRTNWRRHGTRHSRAGRVGAAVCARASPRYLTKYRPLGEIGWALAKDSAPRAYPLDEQISSERTPAFQGPVTHQKASRIS